MSNMHKNHIFFTDKLDISENLDFEAFLVSTDLGCGAYKLL